MEATSRQLHARVQPAGDRNVTLITQVRGGDRPEPEIASYVTPNAVMRVSIRRRPRRGEDQAAAA
jgi:hypothetical protein